MRPKTYRSTRPRAKPGADTPTTDQPTIVRSTQDPRRRAAAIPRGMPTATARINAPMVSQAVSDTREASTSVTGVAERTESPKSPVTARVSQCQ